MPPQARRAGIETSLHLVITRAFCFKCSYTVKLTATSGAIPNNVGQSVYYTKLGSGDETQSCSDQIQWIGNYSENVGPVPLEQPDDTILSKDLSKCAPKRVKPLPTDAVSGRPTQRIESLLANAASNDAVKAPSANI
ncbi:hypothetical protein PSACC_01172 [Paramicrosporidium saccamoebae]|uniref:Uncharacterized protein n=1 Tax=Paramicrosporidium saccamoebae TaxID=1246581 RepID=A0A2H9TMN6_9FUNG|nr:hypothetical protein PSACC_01172 [Paramicrosporidium saccamoebae]